MSIVKDGLQPPGTAKILIPWSVSFCSSINSLNFKTAESVKLNIILLLYVLSYSGEMIRVFLFSRNSLENVLKISRRSSNY